MFPWATLIGLLDLTDDEVRDVGGPRHQDDVDHVGVADDLGRGVFSVVQEVGQCGVFRYGSVEGHEAVVQLSDHVEGLGDDGDDECHYSLLSLWMSISIIPLVKYALEKENPQPRLRDCGS